MQYEHHPANVFPHRVALDANDDGVVCIDVFSPQSRDSIGVKDWLYDTIGFGGRTARQNGKWHAYMGIAMNESALFRPGPCWIGFRDEADAFLFRITWAGSGNGRK